MDVLTALVVAWNLYANTPTDPSDVGNARYWAAWGAFDQARIAAVNAYRAAGLHRAAYELEVTVGELCYLDRGLVLDVATLAREVGAP